MQLYHTKSGILLEHGHTLGIIETTWDELVNRDDLYGYLSTRHMKPLMVETFREITSNQLLIPAGNQEVWAAGVTYLRSRNARIEESVQQASADCYEKVYEAARPELFFKALPQRVAAHGEEVYIRKDARWNVPEPELTLYLTAKGKIQGYTIGNDMSSRDIEGENPLYLPQAKIYERSAALGPCLYVPATPLPDTTIISMEILREGREMFRDSIPIARMKRSLQELADWLYRECAFPNGCLLMTGTGMVPDSGFTLQKGDRISISIQYIGTLTNTVGTRPDAA